MSRPKSLEENKNLSSTLIQAQEIPIFFYLGFSNMHHESDQSKKYIPVKKTPKSICDCVGSSSIFERSIFSNEPVRSFLVRLLHRGRFFFSPSRLGPPQSPQARRYASCDRPPFYFACSTGSQRLLSDVVHLVIAPGMSGITLVCWHCREGPYLLARPGFRYLLPIQVVRTSCVAPNPSQ